MSSKKQNPMDMLQGLAGNFGDEDLDYEEEYFDTEPHYDEYGNETRPLVGRLLLRAVETQLADEEKCGYVREAYRKLQEKGYFKKQAKIKIEVAMSNAIFEMMKYNVDYSDDLYRGKIEEVVAEPYHPDSVIDFETGREHLFDEELQEIDDLANDYHGDSEKKAAAMLKDLWPSLKEYLDDNYCRETKDGIVRCSLDEIAQHRSFGINLSNVIRETDILFNNTKDYDYSITWNQEILRTFRLDAQDRDNCISAIGEALEGKGEKEKADAYYRDWIRREPDNLNAVQFYVLLLEMRGDIDGARKLLEEHLPDDDRLDPSYTPLYERAEDFYSFEGEKEKSRHYRDLLVELEKVRINSRKSQTVQPSKKPKKIYPNDPCPCGSGKKYKKCCGRGKV